MNLLQMLGMALNPQGYRIGEPYTNTPGQRIPDDQYRPDQPPMANTGFEYASPQEKAAILAKMEEAFKAKMGDFNLPDVSKYGYSPESQGRVPGAGYLSETPIGRVSMSEASQMDPRTQISERRPVGMGNPMEHKSPLGIGGKMRDILGGLGDALLIGTGNQPRYAPKRDMERIQDALQGIDMNNPQAVFEQVAKVNPEMALKFMQAASLNNYRADGLDIRRDGIDLRRDDLNRKVTKDALTAEDKIVEGLGGYANSIDNDDKLARFRSIADRRLAPYGLSSDDIGIPKKYTPGVMQDWAMNGIPVYKQKLLEQGDQKIAIGQQNANSNTVKANAAASQAGSRAALVPSQIKKNEASASETPSKINRNNAAADASRANTGLTGGGLPPGVRASRSSTDKIRLPNGDRLLGDGKGGWINKGK